MHIITYLPTVLSFWRWWIEHTLTRKHVYTYSNSQPRQLSISFRSKADVTSPPPNTGTYNVILDGIAASLRKNNKRVIPELGALSAAVSIAPPSFFALQVPPPSGEGVTELVDYWFCAEYTRVYFRFRRPPGRKVKKSSTKSVKCLAPRARHGRRVTP